MAEADTKELEQSARKYWSAEGYTDGGVIREVDYATQSGGLDPMFAGIKIVDTDTHITEAPDLFTSRAPAGLKHKMPRVERIDGTDRWMVGDRDFGTLGGNVANGSPIGDTMPCLMALGATLVLRAGDKTRKVSLDAFYTGMKKSVLQAGEFIVSIELPKPKNGEAFRAHKISKRFDQDISATVAAMRYEMVGGKLKNVQLAYNGMAPSPCRAPNIEAVLEGKAPQEVRAGDVHAAITASFPARDGLRATWADRSLVARNLVMQFVEESTEPLKEVA